MGWFSGFVVFVVIWWIVFFMALPWGTKSPHELGQEPGRGHAPSAPIRPRLWLKVAVVTAVSVMLWGVVYYINANDLITFRSGSAV